MLNLFASVPSRRTLVAAAGITALLAWVAVPAMAQGRAVGGGEIRLPGDGAGTGPISPRDRAPAIGGIGDDTVNVQPDVDDVAAGVTLDTMLNEDPTIDGDDISVRVAGNVATITGSVPTLFARDRIGEMARNMRGVERVENLVAVQPPQDRGDDAVLRDINAALASDPGTGPLQVGVTVNEGIVTLSGDVQTWQNQELVTQLVKTIPGVTALNSRLTFSTGKRGDAAILADVQRRLQRDASVNSDAITATVENGQVRLTGQVPDASARNRAIADAWAPGVTGVSADGLQIGASVRDTALATADTAPGDMNVLPARPDVDVAPSADAARRRARTADEDTPVASARTRDDELRGAVSNALSYSDSPITFDPEIRVENGIVYLSGLVDTEQNLDRVERIARNVPGVRAVENNLQVRQSEGETSDGDMGPLAKAIKEAVREDDQLRDFQISSSVGEDGRVSLFGIVGSEDMKDHAEQVAKSVPGVDNIDNRISVSEDWQVTAKGVRRSDAEILSDIETALTRNAAVESNQVNVRVSDGVATLSGTVESWRDSAAAIRAAQLAGATDVVNNLDVLETATDEMREARRLQAEAEARRPNNVIVNTTPGAVPGAAVSGQPATAVPGNAGTGAPTIVPVDADRDGIDDLDGGVIVDGVGAGAVGNNNRGNASVNNTPGVGNPNNTPNNALQPRPTPVSPPEAANLRGSSPTTGAGSLTEGGRTATTQTDGAPAAGANASGSSLAGGSGGGGAGGGGSSGGGASGGGGGAGGGGGGGGGGGK